MAKSRKMHACKLVNHGKSCLCKRGKKSKFAKMHHCK